MRRNLLGDNGERLPTEDGGRNSLGARRNGDLVLAANGRHLHHGSRVDGFIKALAQYRSGSNGDRKRTGHDGCELRGSGADRLLCLNESHGG